MAFNDISVNKGAEGSLIEIEVRIDGKFVYNLRSDGLIVTSPTGSTAYALSSGGPILHPSLNVIGLVPVCPHTLSNRPIVVGSESEIEIMILKAADARAHFDSHSHHELKERDTHPGAALPAFDPAAAPARAQLLPHAPGKAALERNALAAPTADHEASMLRTLSIRDFVIVDRLDLEFQPGFTVLTGETGAGKSILIDALAAVLGERAESGLVREGREKAEVSAEFTSGCACPR